MYKIPEQYIRESVINKENFTPKEESAQNKKKVRENLMRVKLKHQVDKGIPSLTNEEYNVAVIMYMDVEVKSMRHINAINAIFQRLIKGYVVLKFICGRKVALGYGYKRLNKQDESEIVLEDSFVTEEYEEIFFFDKYKLYEEYLDFSNIKNKNNKLGFYVENMVKSFIISNQEHIKNYELLLNSNVFYNLNYTLEIYSILKEIKTINLNLRRVKTTSEKIGLNKQLSSLKREMEEILDGRN